jgi:transcriptional regulator with XRE-family HTH domain
MYVSQPSVADWESGRKAPHTKNLVRLAVLLEVSFEWLSTGRRKMQSASGSTAKGAVVDVWMRPEERHLLGVYARLKPKQRTALLGFLESLES